MIKRIIVGESGGPTPVIDWEVAGVMDAAQRMGIEVYGMINGLEGLLNADIPGNIVDLTNMDPMSFIFNGPGSGLKTTRIKPKDPEYARMAENVNDMGVDGVVYIGGNDSADQVLGMTRHAGIQSIHAIKTVDNDLPCTHHSPGYGSAALYNATALKNVDNDFRSYGVKGHFDKDGSVVTGMSIAPVVIYQVMGRKAGWLSLAAAFASVDPRGTLIPENPPHVVLCKEVPFDRNAFLARVSDVLAQVGRCVIVVQEDLTDIAAGKSIAEVYGTNVVRDGHGNIQHGRSTSFSPATFLAGLVESELDVPAIPGKVKDCVLNPQHIQRSCMMSAVDASEAYMVGYRAVEALLAGETKKSVVLQRSDGVTRTGLTDMSNIAAKDRPVPAEWIDGMNGPTQDFVDEYIYLIGGPAAIPHYSTMKFTPVSVPAAVQARQWVK
jgi:ATP-dependent phosphofructokinase / diphosphate-dependent phosphofructokinase